MSQNSKVKSQLFKMNRKTTVDSSWSEESENLSPYMFKKKMSGQNDLKVMQSNLTKKGTFYVKRRISINDEKYANMV